MVVIDTPGHEHFKNLRSCDVAILVVDVMHGLEPQTIECLFVVAMNKVDTLYGWSSGGAGVYDACTKNEYVGDQFEKIRRQLEQHGLNSSLYWDGPSVVEEMTTLIPTSVRIGDGIPDLLYAMMTVCQSELRDHLTRKPDDLDCTALAGCFRTHISQMEPPDPYFGQCIWMCKCNYRRCNGRCMRCAWCRRRASCLDLHICVACHRDQRHPPRSSLLR